MKTSTNQRQRLTEWMYEQLNKWWWRHFPKNKYFSNKKRSNDIKRSMDLSLTKEKKRRDKEKQGRAHKNPITSIMNQRISMDRCGKWYAKSVFCFYIWCTWKDSAKIEQTQRFIWNDIFDLYYFLLTSKRKINKI